MLRLVMERITGAIFVLLAVSALVFSLGTFVPGDLTSVIVGQEGATQEQFEEVRRRLGLDQPLPVRYVTWLGNALTGDFGTSPITGRSVSSDLAQQIPVSLELATLTLIVSTVRMSSSRATMAAGTRPPRVIATTPVNGPRSISRQASARASRWNWSQETGKAFSGRDMPVFRSFRLKKWTRT